MIKSLPSYWGGTTFRSRVEARWAVFFDRIKMRWEYEPEGYELGDGTWYLPDFWLPDMSTWAEVKPDDGPTDEERSRVTMLVRGTGHNCLVLNGAPWPRMYEFCVLDDLGTYWANVCFDDKHTVGCYDGNPRLYWEPAEHEVGSQELIEEAMGAARREDVRQESQ